MFDELKSGEYESESESDKLILKRKLLNFNRFSNKFSYYENLMILSSYIENLETKKLKINTGNIFFPITNFRMKGPKGKPTLIMHAPEVMALLIKALEGPEWLQKARHRAGL